MHMKELELPYAATHHKFQVSSVSCRDESLFSAFFPAFRQINYAHLNFYIIIISYVLRLISGSLALSSLGVRDISSSTLEDRDWRLGIFEDPFGESTWEYWSECHPDAWIQEAGQASYGHSTDDRLSWQTTNLYISWGEESFSFQPLFRSLKLPVWFSSSYSFHNSSRDAGAIQSPKTVPIGFCR